MGRSLAISTDRAINIFKLWEGNPFGGKRSIAWMARTFKIPNQTVYNIVHVTGGYQNILPKELVSEAFLYRGELEAQGKELPGLTRWERQKRQMELTLQKHNKG